MNERCTELSGVRNALSMRYSFHLLSTLAALLLIAGCGWGDPGFIRLGDYECDAGEAVVRHLLQTVPDLDPTVPDEFCIVKSRAPTAVDADFVKRLEDTKRAFVSADGVSFKDDLGFPINPRSGVAPIVLHLVHMHQETDGSYLVEAAWAYKMTFERHLFRVKQEGGKWKVAVEKKLASSEVKS
jgi:hypothetical protein